MSESIGANQASHVLWKFDAGGYEPGSFVQSLLETMCRADPHNLALLGHGFPGYAAAVDMAKNDRDGLVRLQQIANGGQEE